MRELLSSHQIRDRVIGLGEQISADFENKNILFVCVLRGGFMFAAHLLNQITVPNEIDFVTISSYKHGTESGELKLVQDLDTPVAGREVIIIEDIVDTGKTVNFLRNHLANLGAASIRVAALLDKPSRRAFDIPQPEYIGFTIPDEFVFGFGLDDAGQGRGLPGVFVKEI